MTNNLLLQEELKRIGFMMNYDPKKVVSENIETTKNLIVENKIETLFTPKTSNEIISETTLKKAFKEVWESRQNLISEQWARLNDQLGYWKILFDNLKKSGIGVKWEVPNDPVKSTYMYWGMWVINKDVNKNGGWPITFTDANKKNWYFKFKGGKYAGQQQGKIDLESKEINYTYELTAFGKFAGAGKQFADNYKQKPKKATSNQNVLPCKKPDGKPIPDNQIQAEADAIFKEIAYAFDGAGTYEGEAVAAYARITCKPLLDKINAKVAARGMSGIKNVQQWLTDEMSDYDYEQYRKIWASLQKVDKSIVAPKVNQFYRGAGIVGDVVGVNAMEKAGEGIQQLFSRPIDGFEKIIEAIRSFLGGVGGAVVTTILDFTGIGKVVTSIGWGLLIVGDMIVWLVKGVAKIPEIILSLISIATTGATGAMFGKFLKPFFGAGTTITKFMQSAANIPGLKRIIGVVQNAMTKIGAMVTKAINWFKSTSWFKKYLLNGPIGNVINKVSAKITSFIDDFANKAASKAGSKATTDVAKKELQKQGAEKIKTAVTTDFGKDLGWEAAAVAGDELGGETGQKMAKFAKSGVAFKTGAKDLDAAKDLKTQAKQLGTVSKETTKTSDTGAKIVGLDVNKEVTDWEQQRRKDAAAAEQKRLANLKASEEKRLADERANAQKYNLPQNYQSNIDRDRESTNVVRQPA